jgi:hypothetical protein
MQEGVDGLLDDPDVPLVAAEELEELGATIAHHLVRRTT